MKTLITLLLLAPTLASASYTHIGDNNYYEINRRYYVQDHSYCVQEYVTKVGESDSLAKNCYQNQALQLAWTSQTYPGLRDNPRRVQYWQGRFAKDVVTKSTFVRELVDQCRGKILSRETLTDNDTRTIEFPVKNLNLDTSITESYMIVPLTPEEAQQELNEALKRCLAP